MREREIFKAALDRTDPAERAAFLDEACGGDAALRARIDALLASHDSASQFLKVPAWQQLQPSDAPTARTTDFSADNNNDNDEDSLAAPDLSFLGPSTNANSIGTLGHYEILQLLGQGAFGLVFKAFDEKLHRHVAIKVMNPQLAATSPPRKRFLREARSAAAIKHENIVQVYSVEEQPLPYLVMEFVDGKTLKEKLENAGPLEVLEILHLGRQMASGLAAAHAQGVIHRDIKPGNILIEGGAEQKVKITDFGLARAADDATMTRTGVISGTPMYMAPEQAQGTALDHRADLFSLGSVLYQMASGRPPFRGPTAVAVLKRVADEDPRPIREILAEVPDWLCAIIGKLHAKRPEDRFQSAKEVAELLAACQAKLQQHGRIDVDEIGLPQTASAAEATRSTVERKPSSPSPAVREPAVLRHRGIAAAAILVVLFAGLGLSEATGVTRIAGTVIRLLSPDGTLVVEVDDPGVSVSIDGEEIVITGTGAKEIRLKPGKYQVQASKDGLVLSQELVTVTTNGRQVVRVSREALAGKPAGAGEPMTAADADRRAAERLVPYAQLTLKLPNGSAHLVDRGAPLPPEPFHITAIFVPYGVENPKPLMSEVILPSVADLTQLQALTSSEASVPCSDEELEQLVHAPVAKCLRGLSLDLSQSERTFDLLKQIPNLSGLAVVVRDGNPKPLAKLAELPHMTDLYWAGSTERPVTADDAEIIARLKLKAFDLIGAAKLDHSFLAALAKQPDLRSVELYSVGLEDDDAETLGSLKQLHRLELTRNRLTDQALSHLTGLAELRLLKLNANQVTGEGVKVLADSLPRCKIEWDGDPIEPKVASDGPGKFVNSIGMEFVLIPKGKAWIGGRGGRPGDKETEFADDFYLGKYEVTQEQWEKVTGTNPSACKDKDISPEDLKRYPVEHVNWLDCQEFIKRLNAQVKDEGWEYRLPTAAEWEYACRGGPIGRLDSAFDFYLDKPTNELSTEQANFNYAQKRPAKVGSYPSNKLGLCDMHGNVIEWCNDEITDDKGDPLRIHRGGCWKNELWGLKAGLAGRASPTYGDNGFGLRVARVRVTQAERPPASDSPDLRAAKWHVVEEEWPRKTAALPNSR